MLVAACTRQDAQQSDDLGASGIAPAPGGETVALPSSGANRTEQLQDVAPTPAGQELIPTSTPVPTETPIPTATPAATPTPVPPTPTPPPSTWQVSPAPELNGDPAWADAIQTDDGALMGRVTATELNIRSAPSPNADILGTTFERHPVTVYEYVINLEDGGDWYRIGAGRFVSVWYVEPLQAAAVETTYPGNWIDVNLTTFYATAYALDRPVYSAIITAGRDERTPRGAYHIFYKVANEVMDSATVGIPEGDPEYYYLENVLFTQYFKEGGFAVHGNHWTPRFKFGRFSSNGCVGLMNEDAAWFWNFLSEGSMVSIHT